ncbi:MAG: ABC transporter ATP-binding protein [Pseudomonadota bacterium]
MSLLLGKDLSLTLSGRKILDRVGISLQPGEILGLIGPNGAGKSSLLKIIAGLLSANTGTMHLGGIRYSDIPPAQRARRIAWLSQQGEVHWPLSVETLIELGRAPHLAPWDQPTQKDRDAIERVIKATDLQALRQRPFNTLSGGEQARVLLARALATKPEILLADEPVAALDLAHQLDVMSLLSNYCKAGRGVIVVLHDLSLAAHFCHRLQLLHHGKVLAVGSTESVLSPEHLMKAYRIRPQINTTGDPFAIPWQRISESDQTKS